MPLDEVLDTMLHELAHIVHGPHDARFHALWDELRDEWQGLALKGFTGEAFLSEGRRLGGSRAGLPAHEARRIARAAAQQQQTQQQQTLGQGRGPGRRLGGASVGVAAARPDTMRRLMGDAAQRRRNQTLRGCAAERMTQGQAQDVAGAADANGFRTQAEEDEANEAAIAQALWELVQEERQQQQASSGDGANFGNATASSDQGSGNAGGGKDAGARGEGLWECGACTLYNQNRLRACEVCGAARPNPSGKPSGQPSGAPSGNSSGQTTAESGKRAAGTGTQARDGAAPVVIDLTESPPRQGSSSSSGGGSKRRRLGEGEGMRLPQRPAREAPVPPQTWRCMGCGRRMERKWWTCAGCGRMKDSSA